jgi:hypothetical protein
LPSALPAPTIPCLTLDPTVGRRLFADGIVRPVFAADGGSQFDC